MCNGTGHKPNPAVFYLSRDLLQIPQPKLHEAWISGHVFSHVSGLSMVSFHNQVRVISGPRMVCFRSQRSVKATVNVNTIAGKAHFCS